MRSSPGYAMRWMLVAIVVIGCVGCDQVTKTAAIVHLKGEIPRIYWSGILRLEYAENPGGFLSLGATWPPLARTLVLSGFNGILMAAVAAAMLFKWRMPAGHFWGCALLFAGGMGNLIDRLRFDGLVVDFLNLGVGPLRTGIFNVADVAITLGAIVLLLTRTPGPATSPTTN
jgi:signal peptidase II